MDDRWTPRLVDEWAADLNDGVMPSMVKAGSNRRVWWRCAQGHEWRAQVSSRTCLGSGCPYCSGLYAIRGVTDLATTHPGLASQFAHDLNVGVDVGELKAGSSRYVWWRCVHGGVWQAQVSNRSVSKRLVCPSCEQCRRGL